MFTQETLKQLHRLNASIVYQSSEDDTIIVQSPSWIRGDNESDIRFDVYTQVYSTYTEYINYVAWNLNEKFAITSYVDDEEYKNLKYDEKII